MATPIAEAFVRVRADTSTIKSDVQQGTDDALAPLKKRADEASLAYERLKVAAQDAAVGGTKLGVSNIEVAATAREALLATRAYEAAQYRIARAAGDASAAIHFETIAMIDQQLAAAKGPGGGGPGGPGNFFEKVAGREAAAGLGAFAGKAGLIGLAATAAFQAVGHLTEALKVDGDEAFTAEGKIRNFGAELLGGDLIGGIQALAAEQKRLSFDELIADGQASTTTLRLYGAETARAARETERLAEAQERQADSNDKAGFVVNRYAGYARAAAVESATFATELQHDADAATNFANALDAAASYGDSLAESMNALAAIPDPFDNPTFRNQRQRNPIGPTTKNEIAQTIAGAKGDLQELLKLQIINRDRLRDQLENTRLNGAKLAALAKEEAAAEAAVIATRKRIAAAVAAQDKEDQAAKDKADATARAGRQTERERIRAEYRADLDYRLGQIKNAEAAALLTEGKADDIRQKRREIAFQKKRENDKNLDRFERQQAQAAKIAAQRDLQDLLKPETAAKGKKTATDAGGRGLTGFDILSLSREIISGYASDIALSGMPGLLGANRGPLSTGAPAAGFDPWAMTNQSPPERNVTAGDTAIVRAIEELGETLKKATRPNVHVEQKFNDPTVGTHRELRYAQVAARALADA